MDDKKRGHLELLGRVPRQRISALQARVDAGEPSAIEELERRIKDDYQDLVVEGKPLLADAAWGWVLARIEEVEATEGLEYEYVDEAEAPARWAGMRVRISYIGAGGASRPSQLAGRLIGATERGVCLHVDTLEEDRDEKTPAAAGSIVRRAMSERFLTWAAILSIMPLPIRACGEGS